MTRFSDEDVVAYVDGRLGAAEEKAFEAQLAGDPELARRVAAHGWMTRQIVAAYGAPPGDELDEALIARLGLAGDPVVSLDERRRHQRAQHWRRAVRPGLAAAWGGALAASLVLGVFVGRALAPPDGAIRMNAAGAISPGPVLAAALDRQLSGAAAGRDDTVRIGLTFRSAQGICRSFVMPGGTSGLGCRENGHWVIPIVARPGGDAAPHGEYRLAGGEVAPAVMAEVDNRIVGEPLDSSAETAARNQGWR